MKTTFYFLMLTLCFGAFNAQATVKTSVADGDWYDPTTWSPAAVPFLEDTLIIAHNVYLDDTVDMAIDYLIINNGASLSGPHIFGLHGNLINNGSIDINLMAIGDGNFTENNGDMDGEILADGNPLFTNNGSIFSDSLTCGTDQFINNADIDVIIFSWGGTSLDNYGNIVSTHFIPGEQCTNHPNATIDSDTITVGTQLDNSGAITGAMLTTGETFNNLSGGNVDVGLITFGMTTTNDGTVFCDNLNTPSGTVSGNGGTFCINQCWVNVAAVSGTLDFCDATPNTLCDINMGTIAGTVTFCVTGACSVGTEEEIYASFSMYPNPAQDVLSINLANDGRTYGIQILTIDGKVVLDQSNLSDSTHQLDVSYLTSGNYIVRIVGFDFHLFEKLIVQ